MIILLSDLPHRLYVLQVPLGIQLWQGLLVVAFGVGLFVISCASLIFPLAALNSVENALCLFVCKRLH